MILCSCRISNPDSSVVLVLTCCYTDCAAYIYLKELINVSASICIIYIGIFPLFVTLASVKCQLEVQIMLMVHQPLTPTEYTKEIQAIFPRLTRLKQNYGFEPNNTK